MHDKLAHFCRSCRNEGYWRKLEEEKRRRSLGGGLKGFSGSGSDYRGVQAGQRVQGPEQRNGYLPDQRNAYIPDQRNAYLPDQRNAYLPDQRSIPDHQSIPNHRNLDQRGMGMIDQRVMIDQRFPDPRILDQRLLMDQRGFVDNRSLGDPRNFVIDQRMVMNGDSRRVGFDQPSLRMNPNGFGVNGMIDQRGLINPGYEREMMDQKAILEHQGIMGQRIMSEKRGMFEQSGLMNILDTPGLSDQRMMVGNGGYDQAGKSSFERMTPEESIGNTRLDQGSSHFGQKRDANGNVKSLGNIL